MTNNYENALVENKNFMLPDMVAGEFTSEDMADDLEGLQISFQRVKIPGGGVLQFEMPGDNPEEPDYTESAEGQKERTCSVCSKKEQQTIPKKEPGIVGYVYIEIRCDTILNNMGDLTPGKAEFVPSNGVILPMVQVPFYENETVFEVLNRICKKANIQIEYSWTPLYGSYYIEGINHLYEFDCGEQSGWMYKVNEWFPNYGCSSYYVEDGDVIVWCYTCKGLGTDVGAERLE